jgi:hypothetical protein
VLWLDELGWAQPGSMGAAPISACELHAWASLTGRHLQAWEVEALLAASRAYLAAVQEANPNPPDDQPMPRLAPGSVAKAFAALNKKAKKT